MDLRYFNVEGNQLGQAIYGALSQLKRGKSKPVLNRGTIDTHVPGCQTNNSEVELTADF